MNTSKCTQRIYVGPQGVNEVYSDALRLILIEVKSVSKIIQGGFKNFYFHASRSRNTRFASFSSKNVDSPLRICCSRKRNTSACQAGDGISPFEWQRLSQTSSITLSFSNVVILSSGRAICMLYLQKRFKINTRIVTLQFHSQTSRASAVRDGALATFRSTTLFGSQS